MTWSIIEESPERDDGRPQHHRGEHLSVYQEEIRSLLKEPLRASFKIYSAFKNNVFVFATEKFNRRRLNLLNDPSFKKSRIYKYPNIFHIKSARQKMSPASLRSPY